MVTDIGFLGVAAGLHTQAAGLFEALASLRPHRAFAYVGTATLHLGRGQAEAAVGVLEQGRRMVDARPAADMSGDGILAEQWTEDRVTIRVFLGLALDAARQHGQALRTLHAALEIAPASDQGPMVTLARGLLGGHPGRDAASRPPMRGLSTAEEAPHHGN